MPEPWGSILQGLMGPYGVIVAEAVVIYFLWKLFREEQDENRENVKTLGTLGQTQKDLTTEVRAWREASK